MILHYYSFKLENSSVELHNLLREFVLSEAN